MSEVTVTANGPLAVKGLKEINNSKGQSLPVQETVYLCRCGHSANKPFCDGSHKKMNFIDEKN
jgi:CDGSH-type Zn-finger protein